MLWYQPSYYLSKLLQEGVPVVLWGGGARAVHGYRSAGADSVHYLHPPLLYCGLAHAIRCWGIEAADPCKKVVVSDVSSGDERRERVDLLLAEASSCGIGTRVVDQRVDPSRWLRAVADAGMVLYTVGTVKKIPGYKNYVSVDGGMTDSPRYALYKAKYTCLLANKMDEALDFKASVVGRLCESGNIIQEDVMLPASVGRYDIIALCTAGAYHYSMASNYNRLPKPPTIMLKGGNESYVVVKGETFEDIVRNDV